MTLPCIPLPEDGTKECDFYNFLNTTDFKKVSFSIEMHLENNTNLLKPIACKDFIKHQEFSSISFFSPGCAKFVYDSQIENTFHKLKYLGLLENELCCAPCENYNFTNTDHVKLIISNKDYFNCILNKFVTRLHVITSITNLLNFVNNDKFTVFYDVNYNRIFLYKFE